MEISIDFNDTFEFIFIELQSNDIADELMNIVKRYEPNLDGLIFTGHIPYDLLINKITPSIPWDYFHRSEHQLTETLLTIIINTNYNIRRVSIDFYDKSTVNRLYKSIGIDSTSENIIVAKKSKDTLSHIEYLKDFHLNNYNSGMVSCCITGVGYIYDFLKKRNVPVFTLNPTHEDIRETLKNIQMRTKLEMNKQSQIVVIYATVDENGRYSFIDDDEYNSVLNHMSITKCIYEFARNIGGVVTERNKGYFLIFTTRSLIETVTENYKTFTLLKDIENTTLCTISVGVGYGKSVIEAKQNAIDGMQRAIKNGGSQAYVIYSSNRVIGPIKNSSKKLSYEKIKVDNSCYIIAKETMLSVNTIYKLHSILISSNKDTFTTDELSEEYGVTPRSMNKILSKLLNHDYASIIGERMISSSGRPSRIIQLKLNI